VDQQGNYTNSNGESYSYPSMVSEMGIILSSLPLLHGQTEVYKKREKEETEYTCKLARCMIHGYPEDIPSNIEHLLEPRLTDGDRSLLNSPSSVRS
jgi:hypothetical protein